MPGECLRTVIGLRHTYFLTVPKMMDYGPERPGQARPMMLSNGHLSWLYDVSSGSK